MINTEKYLSRRLDLAKEVAVGLEDGVHIAARYGFTKEEWGVIETRSDFQAEVSRIRADLEKSGQLLRIKASVMADALLDNTFQSAMSSDTPVKDKVAALQQLARIGGVDTSNAVTQSGPGFSITINIPQQSEWVDDTETVKIKPEAEDAIVVEPMTIGFGEKDVHDRKRDDSAVEKVGDCGHDAGCDRKPQG